MKKTSKRTAGSRPRSRRPPRKPDALASLAKLFTKLGLRWYVFGAQAVNLHGYPRATADLDVTIELGDLSVHALVEALESAGFEPRFTDEDFIAMTRVIPVVHSDTTLPIDLVLAGPGLEQQFLDEVGLHPHAGQSIPVLSLENLIVTKVLAGRPRDLEDVRELVARAAPDHEHVERTLALLEEALGQSDLRPLYAKLRAEAPERSSR